MPTLTLYSIKVKNWNFANAVIYRFRSKKIAYYGYIGGIFFDLKMWIAAKAKTDSSP